MKNPASDGERHPGSYLFIFAVSLHMTDKVKPFPWKTGSVAAASTYAVRNRTDKLQTRNQGVTYQFIAVPGSHMYRTGKSGHNTCEIFFVCA